MRPCDVAALEYLDDFYLGEYRDINYSLRREAVTIVGMNCRTPGKSCFCAATGTGPFARSGFDLMLTLDGGLCWVECATDKGENLVGAGPGLFPARDRSGPACPSGRAGKGLSRGLSGAARPLADPHGPAAGL